MRHRYLCPLRWADLDLLGHVNNVVYVDYLQEARVDMLRVHAPDTRADDLAEGVVVVAHNVTYLAPLGFDQKTVLIEAWVTEIRTAFFTMAYEVFHEDPADPTKRIVYLRATTVLTPYVFANESPRRLREDERGVLEKFVEPTEWAQPKLRLKPPEDPDAGDLYELAVRFSDVDAYGHVNNVKYFEFFQEARIKVLSEFAEGLPEARFSPAVVAQTDVTYRAPILFRPEPYVVRTWISRVGRTSVTLDAEIRSGDVVYATARVVMVFYDVETQSPKAPPERYRDRLLEVLVSEGA